MKSAFESWIGQSVMLTIPVGPNRVCLEGMLLTEKAESLFIKTDNGPEVEIPKGKLLALEERRQW